MRLSGWIFMLTSWAVIIIGAIFAFYRTLRQNNS